MIKLNKDTAALLIGHKIQSRRHSLEMSQTKLGRGICSQPLLSLIENGTQLPMPDVLRMFAEKLDSTTLIGYSDALEKQDFSLGLTDQEILDGITDVLSAYTSKWLSHHEEIAISLCEHYYKQANLKMVQNLALMVINNNESAASTYIRACFYYASAYILESKYSTAVHWLESIVDKMDVVNKEFQAKVFYNLAYAHTENDSQSLALSYALKSAEIFRTEDKYLFYGRTLALLGVIQQRMNILSESKSSLQRAYEILQRWQGSTKDISRVECSLASIEFLLENYSESELWCNKAINSGEESNDFRSAYMGYRDLIAIQLKTDIPVQRDDLLEKAIHLAEKLNDLVCIVEIYFIGAIAHKDFSLKIELTTQAFELSAKLESQIYRAEIADYLGQLHKENGDIELSNYYRDISLQAYRHFAHEKFHKTPLTLILPTRKTFL